jgi:hypothetical protein
MKELYDELRDLMPQERGSKASKWEILSKGEYFLGLFVMLILISSSYCRTPKAGRYNPEASRILP